MSPNWFIGFPVDPGNWYEKVITNVPAGIKSFHPDDLHITLAFLGAAGEKNSMRAWDVIAGADLAQLQVSPGPMAPFGNPEKPSAYAFTLNKGRNEVIDIMYEKRDALLQIAGKGPDKYAPRPHITVARPPRNASDTLRESGLQWMRAAAIPGTDFNLNRIALYTWSADRKKRQFRIVASVLLSNK